MSLLPTRKRSVRCWYNAREWREEMKKKKKTKRRILNNRENHQCKYYKSSYNNRIVESALCHMQ